MRSGVLPLLLLIVFKKREMEPSTKTQNYREEKVGEVRNKFRYLAEIQQVM